MFRKTMENAQIQTHTAPWDAQFPTMTGRGKARPSAGRKFFRVCVKKIFGARKTHSALSTLSDHSLTDIGLTRDQVQFYVASRIL